MNAKILVVIAVLVLGAALVSVTLTTIQSDVNTPDDTRPNIEGIDLSINSISVVSINDRTTTLEIEFNAVNPASATVLLQYVKYTISAHDQRIHVGLIGDRPEGFVASSNFITMLQNAPVKLEDKFSIRNTSDNSELLESIASGDTVWSVDVEVSYNYSSFVAGGENLVTFEFRDITSS